MERPSRSRSLVSPITALRPVARPAVVVFVSVMFFVATATGCGSGSTTSSPTGATTAPTLSSIATIADLQKQLESKGIPCQLEYEGLKQDDKTLSLCVIDGSQATLTIWDKPEVLQKFLAANLGAKGATAVGANWSVDVDTATTAQKVATALGGTVKSPTTPSTAK